MQAEELFVYGRESFYNAPCAVALHPHADLMAFLYSNGLVAVHRIDGTLVWSVKCRLSDKKEFLENKLYWTTDGMFD